MQLSEQGLALIKACEGFSAVAYRCPAGKPTIGYGHLIKEGEYFPTGISPKSAEVLLKQDVNYAEQAVSRLTETELAQHEFDALVSFVYNIGYKAFEKSTLLRYLNGGNKERAGAQFSRWVYAAGKPQKGLQTRRERELALFSGDFPV